ncbi:uncharacterized protein LOC126304667 [Schistocerca gregaria]|uniref:uncharacterized protein LOC126304667 n=1 Tax=Schistocerca gregaria TaxID=7010 RepID=UPI00211E494C|nr:uncharacterized protein LOC126304667 [Schistocerca gregaria]
MSINAKFGNLASSSNENTRKFKIEHRPAQNARNTIKVQDRSSQNRQGDMKNNYASSQKRDGARRDWPQRYRQSRHYSRPRVTRETLDNELDEYFSKNPKVAEEKLNEELDYYMSQRNEKDTSSVQPS